jgi:hypothetical protein
MTPAKKMAMTIRDEVVPLKDDAVLNKVLLLASLSPLLSSLVCSCPASAMPPTLAVPELFPW